MYIHLLVIVLISLQVVNSAQQHTHEHTNEINKERIEDGTFQRDKDHFKDGEHHNQFDHESILGSKTTAEEYDQLSPEESKKRLAMLIPQMDKNQDGFIDKEELTNWIIRSFKMLSKEEAQERMEDVDVNTDGRASWEEYVTETYGVFEGSEEKLNDIEEQKMLHEDKELFKAADKDHDGYLTGDEFLAFTHPEEYEHMFPVLYERTLRDKDIDKDGFINLSEFVGAAANARHHNKEWYVVEKDRFENDYDKDNDGLLNTEELRAWIAPDDREQAIQEAEHLIETADDSKDEVLSYEEVLDHHDTFVGSDATDYGSHLHNTHKFIDEL